MKKFLNGIHYNSSLKKGGYPTMEKNSVVVHTRITERLALKMKVYGKKKAMTSSAVVREALKNFLKRVSTKKINNKKIN